MNSHPSNNSIAHSDAESNALEQRIFETDLDRRLTKIAEYEAYRSDGPRSGEDPQDLKSEMVLAICDKALRYPAFLDKENAYILKAARKAICSPNGHGLRQHNCVSLNENDLDELVADPSPNPPTLSLSHLLSDDLLTSDLLKLAQVIIWAGDDVLKKRSGKLNITVLSQLIGKPERTVHRQVCQLRSLLSTSPALALAV